MCIYSVELLYSRCKVVKLNFAMLTSINVIWFQSPIEFRERSQTFPMVTNPVRSLSVCSPPDVVFSLHWLLNHTDFYMLPQHFSSHDPLYWLHTHSWRHWLHTHTAESIQTRFISLGLPLSSFVLAFSTLLVLAALLSHSVFLFSLSYCSTFIPHQVIATESSFQF